ncbi:MAG: GntR family transcriptional regulator [Pseudonocardiaceae bacterium]
MPEVERTMPPYVQVYRHYQRMILNGEIPVGETIPSAATMRQEWGIAKATATRVSAALQAENLVEFVPGIGLVVTGRRSAESGPERLLVARRTGKVYPPGQHAKITGAELASAPEHVARALGIQGNDEVIRRERVTYEGDVPISMSVSYHPGDYASVAPALLSKERIKAGPGYLEEQLGRHAALADQEITARVATASEVELFHLEGTGTPAVVLIGVNRLITADGEVLEYGESVRPAARPYRFEFEVPTA